MLCCSAAPGASFRTEAAARVDVASTATSQLGMCLRDQDVHSPISIFANKGRSVQTLHDRLGNKYTVSCEQTSCAYVSIQFVTALSFCCVLASRSFYAVQ